MEDCIKAVIFDLGNTLIKPKARSGMYWKLKKKYDLEVSLDDFRKAHGDVFNTKVWGNIDRGVARFARRCKKKNDHSFQKHLKSLLVNNKKNYQKYVDSEPVLRKLIKEDCKIALISNWTQYGFETLEYHNLRRYFHSIAISAHEGVAKPDPRIFRRVLRHLKVKPSEALMVGDHPKKDYLAARELGMHALLLERGRKKKSNAHSIKNLQQVLMYIDKVNKRQL